MGIFLCLIGPVGGTLVATGCGGGSGGDDDDDNDSSETITVTAADLFSKISLTALNAIDLGLNQSENSSSLAPYLTQTATVPSLEVDCIDGGTITVGGTATGDSDSAQFDLDLVYSNCTNRQLDGTANVSLTVIMEEGIMTSNFTLTESGLEAKAEDCALSFSNLIFELIFSDEERDDGPDNATLNGSFEADCGASGLVQCSWNDYEMPDIDDDLDNDLIESACSESQ